MQLLTTIKARKVCVFACVVQFADVCEVDKGSFLGSYTNHLRRLHYKLPLLSGHHVRVLLSHDVKDSVQELKKTVQIFRHTGRVATKFNTKVEKFCCFI